jgi:hypothetical protein
MPGRFEDSAYGNPFSHRFGVCKAGNHQQH